MTAARRRPNLIPRGLTLGETAEYLGHARNWLTPERYETMVKKHGFPKLDEITGRIDLKALDLWLDARSAIDREEPARPRFRRNSWREALNGGPAEIRDR